MIEYKMKPIQFGIVGIVLQAVGLVAFILISNTGVSALGKPIVVGLTLLGVTLLLWHGIKQAKTRQAALFVLPALLALGYVVAFHVVGALGSPGLLRDMEFTPEYLLSVSRVTAIVFLFYVVAAMLLYFVNAKKTLIRKT